MGLILPIDPPIDPFIDPVDLALLDNWQRSFPLVSRPFVEIAGQTGLSEQDVILRYRNLAEDGVLSRIGAVVRPNTVGASTLAAFAVPADELDMVARIVSEEPCVNHNYERENRYNLWFVVTGPGEAAVSATLSLLTEKIPYPLIDLRLERPFHLDLGFALRPGSPQRPKSVLTCAPSQSAEVDNSADRALLGAVEDGIPIENDPFARIAERLGWTENAVLDGFAALGARGIVTRFGTVVRHRKLGFTSNAMAVWNVTDDSVDTLAPAIAAHPRVTLCYRRRRALPDWPYNLYCMIHARSRDEVRPVLEEINREAGLQDVPQTVLFSTRCFKQRGARFTRTRVAA